MLGFAALGAAPLGLPVAAAAAPPPAALTPDVCLAARWRRPALAAAWERPTLTGEWSSCP